MSRELGIPVVFPIHPRSAKRLLELGLDAGSIRLLPPVDFLDFLCLESAARLIFTDSGGVQEEASILGVPCVTLRYNTERPETIQIGANVLAGADPDRILECSRLMARTKNDWSQPYGDGQAGKKIVQILREHLQR